MKYLELKQKQQKEINDFPFGFAFSNEQFKEMMEKFGLSENDTDKIYSIGAGGYIKKTDADAMHEMFKRHRQEIEEEIEKDKTGTGFIYEMFKYELSNHEYCITYDLEPTLDALGLTLDEINIKENLKNGLKKALKDYK
ncbi:MAG: hypothetical protein ACI4PF_00990 [Christensenellales bacterium]